MIREGDRLLVGLSGGKERKVQSTVTGTSHFLTLCNIVQHLDDVMTVFDHVGCLRDACCVRAEMELKTPQPLDIAAGQFDLASCAAGVATPVSCEVHCGCCDCEP